MLIDAHSHLDHYAPDDLPSVLDTLARLNILTVHVSMDPASYQRAQDIAAQSDHVLPIFGIHPWEAPPYADHLDDLAPLIAQSPMLGEIGLDYRWVEDSARYPAQRAVFEYFLAAARDQDKVINVHTKGAEAEVLDLLRRYTIRRPIIHWYSGPLDVFHEMVEIGAFFTVGVEVLHSDAIRTLARAIPADRLLTELDNPGGAEWLTGSPGYPDLLPDVVQAVADLRGTTAEAIEHTVQANFMRLIQDDPHLGALREQLEAP